MHKIFLTCLVLLAFAGCEGLEQLTPSSENDAIRCQITSKGQQGNGYGYEARCDSKGQPVNITFVKISLSARVNEGGKSVSRSFGEVTPLQSTVGVTPDKPFVMTGVVPKQKMGHMFNQGRIVFSANLHYGDQDLRADMDYDALRTEEASFRAKYEILATAEL